MGVKIIIEYWRKQVSIDHSHVALAISKDGKTLEALAHFILLYEELVTEQFKPTLLAMFISYNMTAKTFVNSDLKVGGLEHKNCKDRYFTFLLGKCTTCLLWCCCSLLMSAKLSQETPSLLDWRL